MPAGERRRTYMYVKYTYVTRTASIEVIFSTAARALVPAGVSPATGHRSLTSRRLGKDTAYRRGLTLWCGSVGTVSAIPICF